MKKLIIILILLAISAPTLARVRHITDPDNDIGGYAAQTNKNNPIPTSPSAKCSAEGYIRTMCREGFYLATPCPHNSRYYKKCCSDEFNSSAEECTSLGKKPSAENCEEKYKCL